MGDRAEVKLVYGKYGSDGDHPPIILYTHWGGRNLAQNVQAALHAGRGRWGDEPYLGRIIVSRVVGDQWADETGYGLAPFHMESEYPDLVVHLTKQTVTIGEHTRSFDEFLDLDTEALQMIWQ